jgi:hypothetical protein
MPKRTRIPDFKQIMNSNVTRHTAQSLPIINSPSIKNPAAVALGRLGGLKGGPARAKAMTPAQRKQSALKAAHARWNHNADLNDSTGRIGILG